MKKRHDVHFYDQDFSLVQHVVEFLTTGVKSGQPIVVIATPFHRRAFAAGLRTQGIEIEDLVEGRDRVWLDAAETLSAFMEGDRPNAELFEATVGSVLARLTSGRSGAMIRAYGEMVDLLWRRGQAGAALELERLWNGLLERYDFQLLCAYADETLGANGDAKALRELCEQHQCATVIDPQVLSRFPEGLRSGLIVAL